MLKQTNNIFLIVVLAIISLIIISALIIEYWLDHEPCKLCLYERIPYFLSMLLIIKIIFIKKYEKIILLILSLIFVGSTILAFYQVQDKTFQKEYNVEYSKLDILLKNSDIVSINVNLTDQTKNLINKTRLDLMKSDSILINTSRGGIVNEDILYNALKNEKLAGAGLDVFNNEPYRGPLTELDNVVLTPHIGSYA